MKEDLMCFQSVTLAHSINALKTVNKVSCCIFRAPGNTEIPPLLHFPLLLLLLQKIQDSNPMYHYTHKEINSRYHQFLKSLSKT